MIEHPRFKQLCLIVLLAAGALWLSQTTAQAGADALKLLVKDPVSGGEFEVTEPALLGFMAFADLGEPLQEPPTVGEGFYIIRYWDNGSFDRFHYYPGRDSAPGYLYYDGFLQGWSSSDGKWYQTHPEADQAMIPLLRAHGMFTQANMPGVAVALASGLGIVAIAAGGLALRRGRLAKKPVN